MSFIRRKDRKLYHLSFTGLICFFVASSICHAQRYYVTEDSFGNLGAKEAETLAETQESGTKTTDKDAEATKAAEVEATKGGLEKEPNPSGVEERNIEPSTQPNRLSTSPAVKINDSSALAPVRDPQATSVLPESGITPTLESQEASENTAELTAEQSSAIGADIDAQDAVSNEIREQRERKILSPFEKAYLDAEGQNPYDATVVDEDDYVDGDKLLEGEAERPNEQPFFITRDFDGNENITFFSPSLAKEAQEKAKTKLRYTQASIYTAESTDQSAIALPETADPVAIRILSAGGNMLESYFKSFSRRCCQNLPKTGVEVLEFGRSEHLTISRDRLPFRFSEGDSRYLIFRLPDANENYAIELRAFIRKYKEEGVANGVFYPQLVMLSSELKPLRIIADPLLEYSPENWSGYGFLRGVFEVDRTENLEETFVLINTTEDHLRKVSQFNDVSVPITIKHMRTGLLGVKAIPATDVMQ